MGTCMSKLHKNSVSAPPPKQPVQEQAQEEEAAEDEEQQEKKTNISCSITIASSCLDEKNSSSTDKHVVEICLPISSPRKFVASPSIAAAAARAMAAVSSPADKFFTDHPRREDVSPWSRQDCSCTPTYSRLSFSRDLSVLDPFLFQPRVRSLTHLNRSPSVSGAHDAYALLRTASSKISSPSTAGFYADSKLEGSTIDGLSTTRSRSLPKRFFSREPELNGGPVHKRSSSRDSALEPLLTARKKHQSHKRTQAPDSPLDPGLAHRLAIRGEEASAQNRVYARHCAARKNRSYEPYSNIAPENLKSRKKEKSPLRRSGTGKVADADQLSCKIGRCKDGPKSVKNLIPIQASQAGAMRQDYLGGRLALKDKSVNCSYGWNNGFSMALKKDEKDALDEELKKPGMGPSRRSTVDGELCEKDLRPTGVFRDGPCEAANEPHPMSDSQNSFCGHSLYSYREALSSNTEEFRSEIPDVCSNSMTRPSSILEAVAEDLNLGTLCSEIEESENEFEGEIDLLRLAFGPELSQKTDLQAQQARNLLLKEAAMEAFAKPCFHSRLDSGDSTEGQPSGLASLMAMKLRDVEIQSLEIRKVLKLLSIAEPAMKPAQKAAFYNQLEKLLESVIKPELAERKSLSNGEEVVGDIENKCLAPRVNSWPRYKSEPAFTDVIHSPLVIRNSGKAETLASPTDQLATDLNKVFVESAIVLGKNENCLDTDDCLLDVQSLSAVATDVINVSLNSEEQPMPEMSAQPIPNMNSASILNLEELPSAAQHGLKLEMRNESISGRTSEALAIHGADQPTSSFAGKKDDKESDHEREHPDDREAVEYTASKEMDYVVSNGDSVSPITKKQSLLVEEAKFQVDMMHQPLPSPLMGIYDQPEALIDT